MMEARAGVEEARVATDDPSGVQVEPRTERLDGDDIQVIPDSPHRSRRPLLIAIVVVLVLATTGVAVAVSRRNDTSHAKVATVTPTTLAAPAPPHKTKPKTIPKVVHTPATTAAPIPTAPITTAPANIAPPPTTPTRAKIVATATPSHATVHAGTPVSVTLRVSNQGGTAGEFVYDNDGCPGYELAPPADQICTEIAAVLNVAPGATADKTVTIDTSRAKPGVYNVKYGAGVTVTVTITK
jgi:hypothetical protein